MHEVCGNCGEDYEFDADKDGLIVYLNGEAQYNHIQAQCNHCEAYERIYLEPEVIEEVMQECRLRVAVFAEVPDDVREMYDAITAEAEQPEIDVPHWMLAQLFNDMRHYDKPCDGSCDE